MGQEYRKFGRNQFIKCYVSSQVSRNELQMVPTYRTEKVKGKFERSIVRPIIYLYIILKARMLKHETLNDETISKMLKDFCSLSK